MSYLLLHDGASLCNPGHAGAGFVIKDKNLKIITKKAIYLDKNTNNYAEYLALMLGLKEALKLKIKDIVCATDSNLVVEQMNGKFKVKANNLKPLYAEAQDLVSQFKKIKFYWIPREENTEADELSKDAIQKHLDNNGGILEGILKKHNFK